MKMNRAVFLLPIIGLLATGCKNSNSSSKVAKVSNTYVNNIGTGYGKIVADVPEDEFLIYVSPFNTMINGRLYYYEGDYNEDDLLKINSDFSDMFIYYHAISDRHYHYKYKETDEKIVNVKSLNESYGTNTPLKVDDALFDLLKQSYQFTLDSNGKFNMFLGSLTDLYDDKIKKNENVMEDAYNWALTLANDFIVNDDFTDDQIKTALEGVPTIAELKSQNILVFDEENKTVQFNKLVRDGKEVDNVLISLGGNAKGYATEKVTSKLKEEYPNISYLINSGSSSIKTIGSKPDGEPWRIVLTNPIAREKLNNIEELNSSEVGIDINGDFNLSTSGYYEHYFYVHNDDGTYKRREHIIDGNTGYSASTYDQVCVYLNNSFLADMYTTSIMNTYSISEAFSVFNSLNSIYHQEDASLILCYKSDKDSNFFYYNDNQLSPLDDNGKVISVLKDGTTYNGDYSDISNPYSITGSKSSRKSKYYETYLVSNNLYKNVHIINDSTIVTRPENVKAIIKEQAE
jgi:thiamine biosynthesis lipoprotein ApbE